MASSTLTSKGQVTIPREIREVLGLKEGDRVVFRLDDHGKVFVVPEASSPLGRLAGRLSHLARKQPVTVEEMNAAVRRRARKSFHSDDELHDRP